MRRFTAYIDPPLVSGNLMTRHAVRGKFLASYPGPEWTAFQARVVPQLAGQLPAGWEPIAHHQLILAVPTDRRRDLDNMAKPIHDCLKHAGVIVDDCYADGVAVDRCVFVGRGVELTVVETDGGVDICTRCKRKLAHDPRKRRGPKKAAKP